MGTPGPGRMPRASSASATMCEGRRDDGDAGSSILAMGLRRDEGSVASTHASAKREDAETRAMPAFGEEAGSGASCCMVPTSQRQLTTPLRITPREHEHARVARCADSRRDVHPYAWVQCARMRGLGARGAANNRWSRGRLADKSNERNDCMRAVNFSRVGLWES